MRSSWKTLAAVAASIMLAPQLAAATDSDVEEQLRRMQEQMDRLEDSLQATNDELAAANKTVAEQQTVIEKAGLEERESQSSLSKFLSETEFSGAVAASYFYNFNQPNNVSPTAHATSGSACAAATFGGTCILQNQVGNPFHANANTFQFDEFSLKMSRQATKDMPAGFTAELFFGETADVINSSGGNGGGNEIWVRQAFIDWMTPIGPTVTLGKYDTHIGYETVGAAENYMVRRGVTYNLLQPISQIGVKVHQSYDMGLFWMVGFTNGFSEQQPDVDEQKDINWQIGWGNDMVSIAFNGIYSWDIEGTTLGTIGALGSVGGVYDDDALLILDGVIELTPTDAFTAWLNVTYNQFLLSKKFFRFSAGGVNNNFVGSDPSALGINVGGHVAIIPDKFGVALRYEFLATNADGSNTFDRPPMINADIHTLTATLDYRVTEAMTVKTEFGWEKVRLRDSGGASTITATGQVFPQRGSTSNGHKSQFLAGAQMVYAF